MIGAGSQVSQAAEKFKEAARLQPDKPLFANNSGFACFKLGQYEEAVRWFENTIALDPNHAIVYINLGDAYMELGRKAEAKRAYEEYLELQPNSKTAPGIQEKLRKMAATAAN